MGTPHVCEWHEFHSHRCSFRSPRSPSRFRPTIMTLIWLGSLYGREHSNHSASLFALGFISMFVSGGVSGFFLAQPSIDIVLHATYFVVGHFHMVMGVASIFGVFAGTYFWFGKMTGRMMNETLGQLHFWLTFIGTYCIFMPFPLPRIGGQHPAVFRRS